MKQFSLAIIAFGFIGMFCMDARAEFGTPGFGPVRSPGITNSRGFAAVNSHGFRAPVQNSTRINVNVRVNVRSYHNHYYPQYYQAYQNYYYAYSQWMAAYYRYMYSYYYRRPRKSFSLAISTPFFGLGLSSVKF